MLELTKAPCYICSRLHKIRSCGIIRNNERSFDSVWNKVITMICAAWIGVTAGCPAYAITQEELVYDQVSKYITGQEAADIAQDICDASYTYHVDPILVAAVFTTESNFDNSAVSGVGAIGIAQLMPDTAAQLHVNPYDRKENIYGGVKYLGQMVDRYRTWDKPFVYAEAAYNAGPGAVDRAGGVPHYTETMNYVQSVEKTRQEIWRIAGAEASSGRTYTANPYSQPQRQAVKEFPSLQEWHAQQAKMKQNAVPAAHKPEASSDREKTVSAAEM